MEKEISQKKAYGMMISAMLIVGTIGLVRRYIPLPSALIAFFRGTIGALFLIFYIWLRKTGGWQRLSGKTLWGLLLNGVFLGLNWILLFEAFNKTTIAKATLCYYMQPTIVILLSPIIFKERLTVKKLLCAFFALVGMTMVSGVIGGGRLLPGEESGILLGLGATCLYSLVIILNKKITGVEAYQKTILQLLSSAVVLIPYLLLTGAFRLLTVSLPLILLLLVIGILYTGIVYVLYFGSMGSLKAQTVSTLSYIDPVVAMLVGGLVLREGMSAAGLAGAVLIIGSAMISELTE